MAPLLLELHELVIHCSQAFMAKYGFNALQGAAAAAAAAAAAFDVLRKVEFS